MNTFMRSGYIYVFHSFRYSLHDMPPLFPLESPAHFIDRLASAEEDYQEPTLPSESLVLMRNFGTTSQELQTYISPFKIVNSFYLIVWL